MRVYLLSAAVLALAACGGPAAAPADSAAATPEAAAPAAPAPAPDAAMGPAIGQWEMTLTASGMSMPAQKICYKEQISFAEAQEMQKQAGMTCSENAYTPIAGGITGRSVCTMDGTTITTDSKIMGDFNTAYTMDMTSSIDPAPPGMPNPSTTTINMVRLGDCPPETP